ncbi:LLM class flavin-dependent oxidoreductase [Kribbella deserti]|uniref:LLM class flavin-dependent oxidoreductase n=1 Tax=Kribbella deserti TaxID=1926257 RepID=A0ABV6QR29_9ACTN
MPGTTTVPPRLQPGDPTGADRPGAGQVLLSVLDTAPIWQGQTPADALRDSVALAIEADALGLHRYWVAEHHNAPFIASCAPPVLVAAIAARTTRIRVGSGGVMLPNHAPLVVAEQFGTLEALHPGRIDLGVGRAPGTDLKTAKALHRRPGAEFEPLVEELSDLLLRGERSEVMGDITGETVQAVPATKSRPTLWVLGASPGSGALAGRLGVPFAYAYHVRPDAAAESIAAYRQAFQPSAWSTEPWAAVSASATVAETAAEADHLAGPLRVVVAELLRGKRNGPNLTADEAASYRFDPREKLAVDQQLRSHLIGDVATVRDKVHALVATTGCQEILALTLIQDVRARAASYRLLNEAVRAVTAQAQQ